MSRYNTVVLSFAESELDRFNCEEKLEDPSERDCEPLRQINAWLVETWDEPLTDLAGGWLGMNVCLFGGCFNRLGIDKFNEVVQKQKWQTIEQVRVLFWDEEDDAFTLYAFPLPKPKPRSRRPRTS